MKYYEAKINYQFIKEVSANLMDAPEKIANELSEYFEENYPMQEALIVLALNRKNRELSRHLVTLGTVSASLAHPREVFKPLILASASAFILAHNHPSGDPSPSQADIRLTRQVREAARMMQIDFLDHVVIGQKDCDPSSQGYYSFAESGLL